MFKKIILVGLAMLSISSASSTEWNTEVYAEKHAFSYSANTKGDLRNRFEYRCSVIMLEDGTFGKIDYLNVDLNLNLEDEMLSFQEKYNVNLLFSNGKNYNNNNLPLKSGFNKLDRFTFYLSASEGNGDVIVNGLLDGHFVDVEVLDDSKRKILYRFSLAGSKKSILEAQSYCNLLYESFR